MAHTPHPSHGVAPDHGAPAGQASQIMELKDYDDPEPGATWFIGLASAIVFTALVLGLSVLYYGTAEDKVEEVVIAKPSIEVETLKHAQQELLVEPPTLYTTITPDEKKVEHIRIPISRAYELMIKERALSNAAKPSA